MTILFLLKHFYHFFMTNRGMCYVFSENKFTIISLLNTFSFCNDAVQHFCDDFLNIVRHNSFTNGFYNDSIFTTVLYSELPKPAEDWNICCFSILHFSGDPLLFRNILFYNWFLFREEGYYFMGGVFITANTYRKLFHLLSK